MVRHVVTERTATPWHLWLVGILAFLWSCGGALDYTAMTLKLEAYRGQLSEQQLAYYEGFPSWMVAAWACAVWGSWLGSIALLLRRSWALPLFTVSVLGLFASTVYSIALSNGLEVMGSTGAAFTGVLWVITLGLYYYARHMVRRRVLL